MTTPSAGGSGFENPEAGQGGADAVPDTRGVPAHGTEPNQPATGAARAPVGSRGGLSGGAWIAVVLVALLLFLLYGAGVFA